MFESGLHALLALAFSTRHVGELPGSAWQACMQGPTIAQREDDLGRQQMLAVDSTSMSFTPDSLVGESEAQQWPGHKVCHGSASCFIVGPWAQPFTLKIASPVCTCPAGT